MRLHAIALNETELDFVRHAVQAARDSAHNCYMGCASMDDSADRQSLVMLSRFQMQIADAVADRIDDINR